MLDGVDRRDARRWGREASLGCAIGRKARPGCAVARRARAAKRVAARAACWALASNVKLPRPSRERAEPFRAGRGGAPSRARIVHRLFRPRVECDASSRARRAAAKRPAGAEYPVSQGFGRGRNGALARTMGNPNLPPRRPCHDHRSSNRPPLAVPRGRLARRGCASRAWACARGGLARHGHRVRVRGGDSRRGAGRRRCIVDCRHAPRRPCRAVVCGRGAVRRGSDRARDGRGAPGQS